MDMLILLLLVLTYLPAAVWGHARLMDPPSRSSMWRFGFPTKKNFNDNALYCGGITIQWQRNGGKCGICGDPYNMPHPRENEAGGKYGRGIISKRYSAGQVIEATVDVTTNHRGYFEFKLCPNNNPKKEATQDCLDKHILKEAHGTGVRYYIGDKSRGNITVKLQLPKALTCSQCVFQWTYVAGNNWGRCADGASRLGCGPQETFRGCADIGIDKVPGDLNVTFNENDIESKYGSGHKTRKHGHTKSSSDDKRIDYDVSKNGYTKVSNDDKQTVHDASKHDSKNITETNFTDNHDHQYHNHQNHHHQHDSNEFHYKNGDFFTLSFHQHGSTKSKPNFPSQHHTHTSGNRRKYHKYDNRHFYYISHPAIRQYPTGKVITLDNNWAFNRKQTPLFYKNQQSMRKKDNTQIFIEHHPHSRDSSDRFMDFSEDDSLSHGFNFGGRRYKDFWLL